MNLKPFPGFTVFDIVTILFAVFFFRKRPISIPTVSIFAFFLLGYTVAVITGLVLSNEPFDQYNTYEFLTIFPIFIFARILIDECLDAPDFKKQVTNGLLFTLGFSILFLAIQMIVGIQFSLFNTVNPNILMNDGIRYPSFMSDPQTYSQVAGSLSFLCLIKWHDEESTNWTKYLLLLLAVLGILAAGGRAGLLGWALGFSLIALFSNNRYRIALLLAAVLIYVSSIFLKDQLAIFKRSSDMESAALERLEYRTQAMQAFAEYPFFGIGLKNYSSYAFDHFPNQVWVIDNEPIAFDHPESGYLKILVETGLVGSVFYGLFFLFTLLKTFSAYLRKKDIKFVIWTAALLCFLTGFYSTYSLGDSRIKLMVASFLCFMLIQTAHNQQEADEESDEDADEEAASDTATQSTETA